MDVKELRDLLSKRLYIELQLFKDSKLRQEREEVFKDSYKIEIYVNLYEIFAVHIDNLQEDTIRRLLSLKFGILEFIYQEWLKREDSFYEELRAYACGELETISELGSLDYGKENGDGTEFNQAA
ncbi:MAG: DUF3848 domain-containing protein [Clostridium sp.]|nr:DUF3848 domain-containing protein [Clostridium sp.]